MERRNFLKFSAALSGASMAPSFIFGKDLNKTLVKTGQS